MENPEEILHSLEEFSKMKPKDIPRELEEYLCFVAKTGDPIYQWSTIKSLLREKMINVITEFYESCPSVEIPPCPNVDLFNYDLMKNFILEKLDTFAAAPFTVQRICELLTTPRKEYNRIDKYMRALEKNVLVVSTTEPTRRGIENGDNNIMYGIESPPEINVEEMDDAPLWPRINPVLYHAEPQNGLEKEPAAATPPSSSSSTANEPASPEEGSTSTSSVIVPYVTIDAVNVCSKQVSSASNEDNVVVESATITAVPAGVQKRRSSIEEAATGSADGDSEAAALGEQVPENTNIEDTKEIESAAPEVTVIPPPLEEEEEEAVVPIAVVPALPIDPVTEADLISKCENEAESTGIENISPETSTSSPEDVQVVEEEKPSEVNEAPVQEEEEVVVEEGKIKSDDDTSATTSTSSDDLLVVVDLLVANEAEVVEETSVEEAIVEKEIEEEEQVEPVVVEAKSEAVEEIPSETAESSEAMEVDKDVK